MYEKVYGLHLNTKVFMGECVYILNKKHGILDTLYFKSNRDCLNAYFKLRDNCIDEMGRDEWYKRQGILSDLRLNGKVNMEIFG